MGFQPTGFARARSPRMPRGRWYLNIVVEIPEQTGVGNGQVGIDLGLKHTAACSNGEKLQRSGFYRDSEQKLAKAQRAKQKKVSAL